MTPLTPPLVALTEGWPNPLPKVFTTGCLHGDGLALEGMLTYVSKMSSILFIYVSVSGAATNRVHINETFQEELPNRHAVLGARIMATSLVGQTLRRGTRAEDATCVPSHASGVPLIPEQHSSGNSRM